MALVPLNDGVAPMVNVGSRTLSAARSNFADTGPLALAESVKGKSAPVRRVHTLDLLAALQPERVAVALAEV